MWTPSRRALRVVLVTLLVAQSAVLVGSYADATDADRLPSGNTDPVNGTPSNATDTPTAAPRFNGTINIQPTLDSGDFEPSLDPDGQVTVIATQGFYLNDERAEILAIDRRGEIIYFDNEYRVYFDVDPVPGTEYTIEYVAAKHFEADDEECSAFGTDCSRNVLNRVNLSTGEHERVYAELTPWHGNNRWHDIDRINDTHVVIADIVRDSVRIVDTREEETVAVWNATEIYDEDQGGGFGDWTHINDVELLADGRIMASMRNMDEVVFLERENGTLTANESWTLGEDENHEILYAQHNPDYIPASRGGPAVLVADSENQRILEFHRENGSWVRAWGWKDSRLQWPRDADRLPSGVTLTVDSHGDRVVEVTPDGERVWTVEVGMPYDVERLGTGDESAGGYAIGAIPAGRAYGPPADGTDNGTDDNGSDPGNDGDTGLVNPEGGPVDGLIVWLKDVLPSEHVNGLIFIAPSWVQFTDLLFIFGTLLTGLTLAGSEFYHSRFSVRRGLRRVWSGLRGGLSGRRG